jgi:transcriptional regulator with XRE-family HTH domain
MVLFMIMGNEVRLNIRFGKWLSKARSINQPPWSQAELAKQLERFGLKFYGSTIAKIELGERPVKLAELVAIAELFGVSVDSLLKLGVKPRRAQALTLNMAADVAIKISSALVDHLTDITERLDDLSVTGEDLPGRAELIDGYRQAYLLLINTDRALSRVSLVARENAGELVTPKGDGQDDQ